ncbi:MAG TPA: hypothetical protein VI455_13230 [Terriglobia bacterium]
MRTLTYFLVWAALSGAPELLLSFVIGLISRTLSRAARNASASAPFPSISAVTGVNTTEERYF